YQKPGQYTISYIENNLESGMLNITNSVSTPFYLETSAYLDETTDYSSPNFLLPPIFYSPSGLHFSFSNAAYDKNNYRLVYHLTPPILYGKYTQPESLKINNYNGTITWDGKYQGRELVGTFLLAVRVLQIDEKGNIKGSTMRTFQITLDDRNVSEISITSPLLDENSSVFVDVEKPSSFLFIVDNRYQNRSDIDFDIYMDETIQHNVAWSKANLYGFLQGSLEINSTPNIVRDNPYNIVLRLRFKLAYNDHYYYQDIPLLVSTKNVPLPPITPLIENERKMELLAFPNPCYDAITIFSDMDGEVEIKDMTGKTIEKIYTLPTQILDFTNYAAGCYFLDYRSPSQRKTFRIIRL
ncbi:MAG: T9SS type A sorting domain-containing protein, partial [Cytophagales bacterium]